MSILNLQPMRYAKTVEEAADEAECGLGSIKRNGFQMSFTIPCPREGLVAWAASPMRRQRPALRWEPAWICSSTSSQLTCDVCECWDLVKKVDK